MTEFTDRVDTAAIVYDVTSRDPSSMTTLVEDAYPFGDGKDYPHSSHLTAIMRDLDDRGLDLVSLTVRDA
ncbi:MAG: hypothetical protein ACJA07_001504 [Rhodococcus sp. (in: high G+C Gram-positive bacteria)]|jgi:hypothetical protein